MKKSGFCWVCAALAVCAPALARPQSPEAPPSGDPAKSEPVSAYQPDPSQGRILIDVAVSDQQGNAVTGLEQKDFTLLDEGHPTDLVTFEASNGVAARSDPPVSVILVIDAADLSAVDDAEAESEVERFLRRDGGYLANAVTVYRITSDGLLATLSPSTDGNALASELDRGGRMRKVWYYPRVEYQPGGPYRIEQQFGVVEGMPHRSLDLPIPISMKALGAIAIEQRRVPGRKLLFWIGHGWRIDLKSEEGLFDTITEFSTRLREARIELSIASPWLSSNPDAGSGRSIMGKRELAQLEKGVRFAMDANFANLGLQVLAAHTGGEMLTTPNDLAATLHKGCNDIARLIVKHIAEASSYYRLTFDPPRTEVVDEYHDLKVEMDRPGLTAHTTAGYYDEPVFYDQGDTDVKPVSLEELEQRLAQKSGDRELAAELSGLKLTELFGGARLAERMRRMPGSKSRDALIALADQSAFLETPAANATNIPPPDAAEQRAILARAGEYLAEQIPRLPNFYATRTTVQYGEPLPGKGQTWKTAQADRTQHMERSSRARMFFEDGKEVADQQKIKVKETRIDEALSTTGTFGPILVLTMKGASAPGSSLKWSRWEPGASGPVAVFTYRVAPDMRIFEVGWCCLAIDEQTIPFRRNASFHGEFAVDPATGHVLRLVVQADLEPRLPLLKSGIAVEYGPVEMGGSSYFCPLRSVSMSRERRVWQLDEFGMVFKVYGPYKTILNDVTFDNYHLFRSASRILPGFVPVPEPN